MDEKRLKSMLQLVKTAKTGHGLSVEEIDDLEDAITAELNNQQLIGFKAHMDDIMYANDASDEQIEDFYKLQWAISIGGKTVTFSNDAVAYNGVMSTIEELIENL